MLATFLIESLQESLQNQFSSALYPAPIPHQNQLESLDQRNKELELRIGEQSSVKQALNYLNYTGCELLTI
jgi:hypothetical protein